MIKRVLLAVALMVLPVRAVVVVKHDTTPPAPFCDGTFAFCDTFSAASDPPTNWTEVNATTWANNGTVLNTPTSGTPTALYRTASMGSSDMYAIVKFVNNAVGDQGITLRFDPANGVMSDIVYFGGGEVWWGIVNMASGAPGFVTDVASCTYVVVAGDYITAKVSGTGATRVVEVWRSTAAPTGAPTGTAMCTFTGNTSAAHISPATASGCVASCVGSTNTTDGAGNNKAGLWISGIDSNKVFDDFAAGP